MTTTRYRTINTPVGILTLAGRGATLTHLQFGSPAGKEDHTHDPKRADWERDDRAFGEAVAQLEAYFAGELTTFSVDIELAGTTFQRRVWSALQTIPYGETRSYGEIAEQIGAPGASRAVGLANGRNPIGIIVPCHRVIGANGSLTGYGGGLDRKRALLDLEKSRNSANLTLFD
jgi:methylated-DNA-[protein]-cysteine S-methyltransferase